MEEWKEIENSDGKYFVSNKGRVKNIRGNILKPYILKRGTGYLRIKIIIKGARKSFLVHRLVAIAFLNKPKNMNVVNHKNENGLDNSLENLEWCDQKYNMNYGTVRKRQSKNMINHKSLSKRVVLVKENGEEIIYPSVNEVSREYGISRGNINSVISGKRKHAGGFVFKRPNY